MAPPRPVYLDYQATTPVDPRVVEAMAPYFTEQFGNAASRHHAFGWAARDAVEQARRQVADLIDCDPREVYFTSGATESNNLAIKGVVDLSADRAPHIVTVATEHRAVLDPCRRLETQGATLTLVTPGQDGLVTVESIERALTPDTTLVSVMAANNEIGVLQPLAEIAALTRDRGILLHTDAVQIVGKMPFSVGELGVDLASLSAHKIYGPKGVGAMYVRRRPRIPLAPLFDGGGHERGVRSGTVNVPGIVGFGRAAQLCSEALPTELAETAALRDRLRDGFERSLTDIQINGSMEHRLPNNLNIGFAGVEGETLLVGLDDIAVSSGAACTSANPEPSHVLRAIGLSDELARASLRFSVGRWTTTGDIDYAVQKVSSLVRRLREVSPTVNRSV